MPSARKWKYLLLEDEFIPAVITCSFVLDMPNYYVRVVPAANAVLQVPKALVVPERDQPIGDRGRG